MKKIIITAFLFVFLGFAAAAAQEPIDLMTMKEAGLSSETIGRYLAQNLGGQRAAPPVDANLLTRLGRYGGDPLALAYLDLDKRTAHMPSREFSPEVVDQLVTSGVAPDELTKLLNNEAARFADGEPPIAAAPPEASPADDQATAPVAPLPPKAAKAPSFPPLPPYDEIPTAPATPAMTARVIQPEPKVRPSVEAPSNPTVPIRPRTGFQQLRPGQAADPGSPLPLPYSTYDIRNQRMDGDVRAQRPDGNWMGVRERELSDGHLAEVNIVGDAGLMGQEVYSRPSGHKVYRYFTGNPDNPRSGADSRQERQNREDLDIIFQSNRR